jgi:hypothetical protein
MRWVGRTRSRPAHAPARRAVAHGGGCTPPPVIEDASVGAAVVSLGPLAVTFAWAQLAGRTVDLGTHASRCGGQLGRARAGGRCGREHALGTGAHRGGRVVGDRRADRTVVGDPDGRLQANDGVWSGDVEPGRARDPDPDGRVELHPEGRRNDAVTGAPLARGGTLDHELDGTAGGWRDWTSGRQDRTTVWRWAAGAGTAAEAGGRVGINLSSGMNAREEGEDIVWWDGVPVPLPAHTLRPVSRIRARRRLGAGRARVGGSRFTSSRGACEARAACRS